MLSSVELKHVAGCCHGDYEHFHFGIIIFLDERDELDCKYNVHSFFWYDSSSKALKFNFARRVFHLSYADGCD